MANIDLSEFEFSNIEKLNGQISVRRALRLHASARNFQADSKIVAAFTVESANTGEVAHYLFLRATADSTCTCYVTTEEYQVLYSIPVGIVPEKCTVTYAASNNQLLVNSPDFKQPLYGIVGGGLIPAVKVASVKTTTTALDIPRGICCTFGDRIAIAQDNFVYFNDPGVEIRTFVAINSEEFDGKIYGMFQSTEGLWIIHSQGIAIMATDGLGQGQSALGFVTKRAGYQASGYRNVAQSNGQILGVLREAVVDLRTQESEKLTSYTQKRTLSPAMGLSLTGDLRAGTIWTAEDGFYISAAERICHLDVNQGIVSWIFSRGFSDLTIVGILKSREGTDLIVTPDSILQFQGNREYDGYFDFRADGYQVDGYTSGTVPSDPSDSPVVRFISTISDNVGLLQGVSLRGQVRAQRTPPPPGAPNIVGQSVWDGSEHYVSAEARSRRHAFSQRTDDISIEVYIQGSFSKIAVADVVTKGQGRKRP